ncbi:MAG: hypothetical protein II393_04705 [Cytophagales bacterium]|nr:hypothetical protein [Cytophagales bacterium]
MSKYLFKIVADRNDTVDKLVKAWKKRIDNIRLLKNLKGMIHYVKPKELRKVRKSQSLYLQHERTERNR